jgi:transketolase
MTRKPPMPTRREFANAIRALSMDAVQKANSGHPGAPMGMADIAELLWRDVLKFNPGNPLWWDRDRFVLSNCHASMLLYSVLHLTGYRLPMDELKKFRQFGSLTPGHPERDVRLGIETTTGPLGQGLANAAGGALAERSLAATFNLICANTVIGWGAPHKQGTASMHGEPVGTEEIAAARERLGWTFPPFEIPAEVGAGWDMREKESGPSGSGARNLRPTRPNSPPWRPNRSGASQGIYLVGSTNSRRPASTAHSPKARRSAPVLIDCEGPPEAIVIDTFGASAPAQELFKHFGFTPDHVTQAIDRALTA